MHLTDAEITDFYAWLAENDPEYFALLAAETAAQDADPEPLDEPDEEPINVAYECFAVLSEWNDL